MSNIAYFFCRTSKMSHAGSWRAACDTANHFLPFHFGNAFGSTRRDRSQRWLWRLVSAPAPAPVGRQRKKPDRNQPQFDLRSHLHRILGVDLTALPGFSTINVHTLFSEVGCDVSKFPTVKHFSSWLGLCPDLRITGGKVVSAHTRTVKSRAACALRMAAYSAGRSYSAIGDYFRRMRARLGTPKAITATAHKLARIIYHLLKTGSNYDDTVFARNETLYQQRRESHLRKQARELGFTLTPLPREVS